MTMQGWYNGPPGITTGRTTSHRVVFLQRSETFLAQGRLIDGTKSRDPGNDPDVGVLRPGLLMGRVTANDKYAPSIIGVTQGAYTAGGTSVTVTAAQATEIVRRVGTSGNLYYIGPPAAAGTVAVLGPIAFSAVNTSTGVITTATLGANLIAGGFVAATDGSHLPLTLIPDWDYGVLAVDPDGNSYSSVDFPKLPVAGVIDSSQILPAWPSDTSLRAWICTNLSTASGGKWTFDHIF